MSIIPTGQNLFVVDLSYQVPLEEIEPLIDAHMAFLESHYASGTFIASGAKVPRTGGVIIATAPSQEALEIVLKADPFQKIALYTITEFRAGRTAPGIA